MLSKPVTVLLGIIHTKPINTYEIIKMLEYMNVKKMTDLVNTEIP